MVVTVVAVLEVVALAVAAATEAVRCIRPLQPARCTHHPACTIRMALRLAAHRRLIRHRTEARCIQVLAPRLLTDLPCHRSFQPHRPIAA